MSEIISIQPVALPAPRTPITIRAATLADIPFMDALQKKHGKALGFFSRALLEGYITNYRTLIAQDAATGRAVGYIVSTDRYLKRDELGAVFQLCVDESHRRGFIAAALLKEVFEQSAYGCRLYCCWCAQDLPANRFWESMGFVPLAFRAGSEKKRVKGAGVAGRVHIFWQKRIRAGDTTTPWWFPAKTEGGLMREDRVVLPIPLDRHWSDEMPRLLPGETPEGDEAQRENQMTKPAMEDQRANRKRKALDMTPPPSDGRVRSARQFDGPSAKPVVTNPVAPANATLAIQVGKPAIENAKPAIEKVKKPKPRADKQLIAAARELKDRWLEQVNAHPEAIAPAGKYDVVREIESPKVPHPRRLAA